MLMYLLKFSACLAIFMVFYKLFLERENMHHLKRYYLLLALLLSLGIPLVTIIQYVEPTIMETLIPSKENFVPFTQVEDVLSPTNYTPVILWSIYAFGFLIFGLKFSLNLFQIFKKIKRNPKFKSQSFVNVLLTDLITPHTFFSYIFLNKHKYEAHEIPQEVFIHEQTHAKQKHSIDVLFIELLQVVFWFNPLLYFIKKDIKLNHEFLADQAVLNNGIQQSAYQNLLLAFSSDAQNVELANAINYSSIKKRFTVMKTHTSKQKIWLRSFLLLPLVALTLYGFSETKIIEKEMPVEKAFSDSIDLYLNEKGELLLNEKIITLQEIQELYKQNKNLYISIKAFPNVDSEIVKKTVKEIQGIGFKKMTYCTSGDTVNATPEEARIEMMNSLIEAQKQKKATPEEVEWYNDLIKDINSRPEGRRIFKQKDVIKIEDIYKRMSKEQKANAEPFPNFPPPPPAPDAPKVLKDKVAPPPPPIPADATPEHKKKMQAVIDNYDNDVPPPPAPPVPKSPLDHVIEMAKKGATFYYEGKSISSDEAIKLLKKNDELNIQTKQSDSKNPKVYISKEPIVIKE